MNPLFLFISNTWETHQWVYLILFTVLLVLFIFRKKDYETIGYIFKKMKKGEDIIDPTKKAIAIETFKKVPKALFKESAIWILVVIFVFAMGTLVGFKYSEVQCNNFIIENYGDTIEARLNLTEISPGIPIFNSDISKETGNQEYNTINSPSNPKGKPIP